MSPGFRLFDPAAGTVIEARIERQTGSAAVQANSTEGGGR